MATLFLCNQVAAKPSQDYTYMYLWNDYEGQTLAGSYPLEKLLRTEGRSAFFATRDGEGRAAVVRLTEALNDQQQMFARYRAIKAVGQRELVAIKAFGETEFDGEPLIYLVMEPTQESLADILVERRLTIEETNEVASSVVSAVEALHANGLVHGQVEPVSVLAAGEVIKLRSDCARPAPEGEEGTRARAEDVVGVADVLHRSLTQQRLQGLSDALALPEPYASIVRNTWRGSWGIEQVAAELRRTVLRRGVVEAPVVGSEPVPMREAAGASVAAPIPVVSAAVPVAPGPSRPAAASAQDGAVNGANGSSGSSGTAASVAAAAAGAGVGPAFVAAAPGGQAVAGALSEASRPFSSRASVGTGAVRTGRFITAAPEEAQLPLVYAEQERGLEPASEWDTPEPKEKSTGLWVAAGLGAVLLILGIWYLFGGGHAGAVKKGAAALPATAGPSVAGPAVVGSAVVGPAVQVPGAAAARTASPIAAAALGGGTASAAGARETGRSAARSSSGEAARSAAKPVRGEVWRVVAYTYKSEAQAQAKVRSVGERHRDLHPQVFSRTGRGPYLVTLGGSLTRDQAAALRQRARREGLAGDVYIQNYSR